MHLWVNRAGTEVGHLNSEILDREKSLAILMFMAGSVGRDWLGVNGVSEMGMMPSVSGMTVGDFSIGSVSGLSIDDLLVCGFYLESFAKRDFGARLDGFLGFGGRYTLFSRRRTRFHI
jgi:hypothetical protein